MFFGSLLERSTKKAFVLSELKTPTKSSIVNTSLFSSSLHRKETPMIGRERREK
jgi:hypothetical protein